MGTRIESTNWEPTPGSEPEALTHTPAGPEAQPAHAKAEPEDQSVDANEEGPSFSQYLSDEWEGAKHFAESPLETAGAAINKWADDFDDCASPGKQISKLKTGDDCTFKFAIGAGARRFEAESERSATVQRDGKGYSVKLCSGGEVTANLSEKSAAGELEAKAGVKTGTTAELHFATAEEAERAVQIFARQAAADAAGASMPMFNVGTHSIVADLAGPSADDKAFLARAKKSDEVEVGGVLKLEGSIGPECEALKSKLIKAGVEAEPSVSAKIKYDANGNPSGLVVESHFKISGEAQAGLFSQGAEVSAARGKHELEITTEQEYALPKGVTLKGHDYDPIEFAAAYARQMKPVGSGEVKVRYEGDTAGGKTVCAELELDGGPSALAKSDVLDQLLDGKVHDALASAKGALGAKAELKVFDTSSHHVGGKAEAKGLGAELELESTRRHVVMNEKFGE